MKALVVIDSLGRSGAELHLASLLPRLTALGVACEVAALMPPYDVAADLESRGIRVHRLDLSHRWDVFRGYSRLRALRKTSEFQTVLATLFFGQLHATLAFGGRVEPRLVIWLQSPGYTAPVYCGFWALIREQIHGWVCRRADTVIACSRAVGADYQSCFGLPPLQVIYNAVFHDQMPPPINEQERRSIRARCDIPSDALLLTVAARYSIDKGHRNLLDALSILRAELGIRPFCICAGAGPLKEQLEAYAVQLELAGRVRFVGPLPQAELYQLIQSSDALVLPSVQEALGLAPIEAMVLGTPAVVINDYGLAEVAEGGAAFTAEPGSATSLAAAIAEALTDNQRRAQVIQAGRHRAENTFNFATVTRQWADVLSRGRLHGLKPADVTTRSEAH